MPRSAPEAGSGPSAYQRALRRLGRRDHSEAELRRVLEEHGHSAEQVDEALDRLRERRLVDDESLAERFSRSRLAHHGLGRGRIRQGLRRRGVARAHVEKGLAAALREVSEAEVLDRAARRYWRQHAGVEPRRRLPRLWAFLLRRGFAPGLVRDRLAALWPRWADSLEGLDPVDTTEEAG